MKILFLDRDRGPDKIGLLGAAEGFGGFGDRSVGLVEEAELHLAGGEHLGIVGAERGRMKTVFQKRQRFGIDLRTPGHHNAVGPHAPAQGLAKVQRGSKVRGDMRALGRKARVAGQNDRFAARKGFADRLERLAPHQHRMTQGQLTEPFQIRRQLPDQPVIVPDHSVIGNGSQNKDRQAHALASTSGWPV
jgi:hypothetical protein